MNLIDVVRLGEIAEIEFADIVTSARSPGTNLVRILLLDGSFIDVRLIQRCQTTRRLHERQRRGSLAGPGRATPALRASGRAA